MNLREYHEILRVEWSETIRKCSRGPTTSGGGHEIGVQKHVHSRKITVNNSQSWKQTKIVFSVKFYSHIKSHNIRIQSNIRFENIFTSSRFQGMTLNNT